MTFDFYNTWCNALGLAAGNLDNFRKFAKIVKYVRGIK